jgi:pyrroloquinoline quinone biosynthesis protein B
VHGVQAVVLGSAAGGGFPQWNSAGAGCIRARNGDAAALPRTQTSLAIRATGDRFLLLNAAPDLRAQILSTPALWPRPGNGAVRHSPIAAVLLTGAEIDTIAGLLSLRERHAFALYGTRQSLAVLAANPIFNALDPARVPRRPLRLDQALALSDVQGAPLGLVVEAFAVPGKVPLFAETAGADPGRADDGETIGLRITTTDAPDRALFFIPGCAAMTADLALRLRGADCVLFDGTLWQDDEMIAAGAGPKTGARMGHMSISGADGVIAAFRDLDVRRKILIHLNNTNPVLLSDSFEHAEVRRAGWDVAHDGMEISL